MTIITQDFYSLEHRVKSGVTYYIASDGYDNEEGNFELNYDFTPAPVNDDFVNAIALTGTSGTAYGSNLGATEEDGEPGQSDETNSVWWTWTAPSDGTLVLDTNGSNFASYLSLFTGGSIDNLTVIAQDRYSLAHQVESGVTYYIAGDGYGSEEDNFELNYDFASAPADNGNNDDFANAIALTGTSGTAYSDNIGATGENEEPEQSGETNSVWWTWTAPSNGTLVLDTNGSSYDTFLSLFAGSSLTSLTTLTQDDDGGDGSQSLIEYEVQAGTVYYIAVDGYGDNTGNITLNYNLALSPLPPAPPANDNFADAIALTGTSGTAYGSNTGATEEDGEPGQSGETDSVWWTWTAPSDGTLVLDTNGSNYDTFLSLFAGSSLTSLTTLAQDDDSGDGSQSRIEYEVQAGTVYYIAVDGYGDNTGNTTLKHDFIPLSIVGTIGDDSLIGGIGRQSLQGLEGDDLLNGVQGNDTLEGGAGADKFEISRQSYSIVQDFSSMEGDVIQIGTGNSSTLLQANQFLAGADISAATTPDHRVLYDTSTGQVFYDADGSYTQFNAVHIATLANNAALNASDIYLFSPM